MKLEALVGGVAPVIGPEASVAEAAEAMIDADVSCLAVVDRRDLVGLVTERDIVGAVAEGADLDEEAVREWMSEAPDTFSPTVKVSEAASWLLEAGYRHLPVMADDELLGIVGIRDILWALAQAEG